MRRRMTMKAKTIRRLLKVGLIAFAALASWGFAGTANAQMTPAGRFNLPFEVHWGRNVLPPGQYTIFMDSSARTVLVQSNSGKNSFYTTIPILKSIEKGSTAQLVLARGNERMVRSLNLPGRGLSLMYSPATNAEREETAKANQVEAVPVITARK
jgi:hypothetical protein